MSDLTYMKSYWFETLQAEVARTSRQKVADLLGISRTTVSLVMSGKYGGKTGAVAFRVMDKLGKFPCLYDEQVISPHECRTTAQAAAPTHNPAKLAQWSACQRCPKNMKGICDESS